MPADGYYEWKTTPAGKLPHWFTMADGEPFFFGGIWDRWYEGRPDSLPTYTLLTTAPNELAATVHDRMPVIVRQADYVLWLDPTVTDRRVIEHVLEPFPAELMKAYPVGRAVNNPKSEGPELIRRWRGEGGRQSRRLIPSRIQPRADTGTPGPGFDRIGPLTTASEMAAFIIPGMSQRIAAQRTMAFPEAYKVSTKSRLGGS